MHLNVCTLLLAGMHVLYLSRQAGVYIRTHARTAVDIGVPPCHTRHTYVIIYVSVSVSVYAYASIYAYAYVHMYAPPWTLARPVPPPSSGVFAVRAPPPAPLYPAPSTDWLQAEFG